MATENPLAELEFIECDERRVGPQCRLSDHLLASKQHRLEISADDEDWMFPDDLACWTTLASFYLPGEAVPLGDHGWTLGKGFNLAIVNSFKKWVGSIMMDQQWVSNHPPKAPCEFMLMSRSTGISDAFPPPQPKYFQDETFVDRPWCMLNFILIERGNDVARRLGAGFIHDVRLGGSESDFNVH